MKLLLDENLSPRHAETLRELGFDALSVTEMGLSGADDDIVHAAALETGRVLITLDADFANVLRYPPSGTVGVIRLRVHPATEANVDSLLRNAIPRLGGIDLAGRLAVVDPEKIRIRS